MPFLRGCRPDNKSLGKLWQNYEFIGEAVAVEVEVEPYCFLCPYFFLFLLFQTPMAQLGGLKFLAL